MSIRSFLVLTALILSAGALLAAPAPQKKKGAQVEEYIYAALRDDGELRISGPDGFAVCVRKVEGRKLLDPVFRRRDAEDRVALVLWAREAEVRADPDGKWVRVRFSTGEFTAADGSSGSFTDKTIEIPLPDGFGKKQDRP